jgi:hypothetical protein
MLMAGVPRARGVNVIAPVPRQRMQSPTAQEGDPSLEERDGDDEETLHRENNLQTTFDCNSNVPARREETQAKESSRMEPSSRIPVCFAPQDLRRRTCVGVSFSESFRSCEDNQAQLRLLG